MPKKKTDEEVEGAIAGETVETAVDDTAVEAAPAEAVEETAVEAAPAEEVAEVEAAEEEVAAAPAEAVEETAVEAAPAEEIEAAQAEEVVAAPVEEEVAVEAAPVVEEKPKKAVAKPAAKAPKVTKPAAQVEGEASKVSKRAEKIGIVASDKMTKTVTVRVDRLVKHPIYRKYVKKRKKFMAHDELGAKIGDKVRIVETRPMSARKRWRVVEILHKAEL